MVYHSLYSEGGTAADQLSERSPQSTRGISAEDLNIADSREKIQENIEIRVTVQHVNTHCYNTRAKAQPNRIKIGRIKEDEIKQGKL